MNKDLKKIKVVNSLYDFNKSDMAKIVDIKLDDEKLYINLYTKDKWVQIGAQSLEYNNDEVLEFLSNHYLHDIKGYEDKILEYTEESFALLIPNKIREKYNLNSFYYFRVDKYDVELIFERYQEK